MIMLFFMMSTKHQMVQDFEINLDGCS